MRYDCIIIGSGPAGLSAAVNAKIRNKNIIAVFPLIAVLVAIVVLPLFGSP